MAKKSSSHTKPGIVVQYYYRVLLILLYTASVNRLHLIRLVAVVPWRLDSRPANAVKQKQVNCPEN